MPLHHNQITAATHLCTQAQMHDRRLANMVRNDRAIFSVHNHLLPIGLDKELY